MDEPVLRVEIIPIRSFGLRENQSDIDSEHFSTSITFLKSTAAERIDARAQSSLRYI